MEHALADVQARLRPARQDEIIAELGKLAVHYYRPNFTEAQAKQLYRDYIQQLGYPLDILQSAIVTYHRNPNSKWFPRIGELVALCDPLKARRLADLHALQARLESRTDPDQPDLQKRKRQAAEARRMAAGFSDLSSTITKVARTGCAPKGGQRHERQDGT